MKTIKKFENFKSTITESKKDDDREERTNDTNDTEEKMVIKDQDDFKSISDLKKFFHID